MTEQATLRPSPADIAAITDNDTTLPRRRADMDAAVATCPPSALV